MGTNCGIRWPALVVVTIILACVLIYGHGGDTTLIHACVKNSGGAVRIVGANDSCNSNETPIHWSIAGPPGAQGPQGVPGPPGPAGPEGQPGRNAILIRDSLDQQVGYLHAASNAARIVGGTWLTFQVRPSTGFVSEPSIDRLFTSTDCSGTMYRFTGGQLTRFVQIMNGIGYYAGDPLSTTDIKSYQRVVASGTVDPCSSTNNLSVEVGPLATLDIASFGLVAPFRLVE